MLNSIASVFIGFLVTVTLLVTLRPMAGHLGLVDIPGGRKTHHAAVPVIGGLAIFAGVLAAVLAMAAFGTREIPLMAAAGMMVAVGAMDDRFDIPPTIRILVHLAAVMTLVLSSDMRVESLGNLLGLGDIRLGPAAFVFTVAAAIALINAFNMLDGLDGLAGGVALVALSGLTFFFWGEQKFALIVALSLVGSISAFLIFNLPAKFNRPVLTFMGDAGSTLLGFAMAGLALAAVQPGAERMPPVIVLWLLPVPILELFTSTFRRIARGLSPMQADRGHFHHQLLDAGFSVRSIFILYLGASAISAIGGHWAWSAGASEPMLFYSFLLLSGIWVLGILQAKRFASYLPESLKRGELPQLRPHRLVSAGFRRAYHRVRVASARKQG